MKRLIALGLVAGLMASSASAQREREPRMVKDVAKQRTAITYWSKCLVSEQTGKVASMLNEDYREKAYDRKLEELGKMRVSQPCYDAIPREYRRLKRTGLPFVGGLAEEMIERSDEPLVKRLSYAAIGKPAQTFSYTDQVANCILRGAPNLAADLFATEINSDNEIKALEAIDPVKRICTSQGAPIEASPLAMRSMLATAAFRLLDAQTDTSEESQDDA